MLLYDVVNDVVNADFKRVVTSKIFPVYTRIFSVSRGPPKTRHRCDHAKQYSKEILINDFSFLTESSRILEGAYSRGGLLKNSSSKGGLIGKEGLKKKELLPYYELL